MEEKQCSHCSKTKNIQEYIRIPKKELNEQECKTCNKCNAKYHSYKNLKEKSPIKQINLNEKRCTTCKKIKTIESFNRKTTAKYNVQIKEFEQCNDCSDWYKAHCAKLNGKPIQEKVEVNLDNFIKKDFDPKEFKSTQNNTKLCLGCNRELQIEIFIRQHCPKSKPKEYKVCNICSNGEQKLRKKNLQKVIDDDTKKITKKCTSCDQYLTIDLFMRKQYKNDNTMEFQSCNNCSVKIKEKRLAKEITVKPIISEKCPFYNCLHKKVMLKNKDSLCSYHGGILHVFKTLIKDMRSSSSARSKKSTNTYERSRTDLLPSIDELIDLFKKQNGRCVYSGSTLEFSKGYHSTNAISIDRIDSTKGYSMENIVFCSMFCNKGKNASNVNTFCMSMHMIFTKKIEEKQIYQNLLGHHVCKNNKVFLHSLQETSIIKSEKRWSYDDIKLMLIKQNYCCAITGIPFCLCDEKYCSNRPSLDRIDNNIEGHDDRSNCHIVLKCINLGRSANTIDELLKTLNQILLTFQYRDMRFYEHLNLNERVETNTCSMMENCFECTSLQEHQKKLNLIKNTIENVNFIVEPLWKPQYLTINDTSKNELTEDLFELFTKDISLFYNTYSHEEYFQCVCYFLDSANTAVTANSGVKRKRDEE